jgi:hypothetical protein
MHPQEHASDLLTLTENLSTPAAAIESAKSFADEKDLWISPLTMQRRFNANVSGFELPNSGNEMPPAVDPLMMSLYGACFTAGSLKHVLESTPGAVTYYETVGERGLIQGENASAWPGSFSSCPNMVFPLFHVFSYLLNFRNNRIIKCSSSSPLDAEMLAVETGDTARIIIINYTPAFKKIRIQNLSKIDVKRVLSTDTFPDAVSDPDWIASGEDYEQDAGAVLLPPCSVIFASAKI